ncbi:hypothetical protein QYE76_039447 [Lolium multiflorum]|uniref:CCHC-type domain-containing protein n=1 Tax=Lolium multiflorum TaxID=4521 RepID=A0AAD8TB51_LOLMU|nr:hypothetical protein QYE76_039447 [Lolium multiflorum]
MDGRVSLSGSGSGDSVSSRAPPPPLRSLVVAPASHQLGSRGWDAGAGPSRAARAPAPAPPAPAGGGGRAHQWHVSESRRARNLRRAMDRSSHERRGFPASRPPAGAAARIPAALHGCCYNCGQEGHISADCNNATLCVRCGGTEHTSRDCKRPRSSSSGSPPRQVAPLLRPAAAGREVAAPASGPSPARVVDGRSWRDVVSSVSLGGTAGSSAAVGFSAPFAPSSPSAAPSLGAQRAGRDDQPEVCYLLPSQGMVQLEADLDRAVMVSVSGARGEVSLDMAATAIQERLGLTPLDFSIRAFDPSDFLILCASLEVRDLLISTGVVASPCGSLHLEPWSRQVGAAPREAPFLAEVEIRGIPGHAWAERTATQLLLGCGIIDAVDPATASRSDMSSFRLSLWTHDVAAIPAVRWLAVPEPGSGLRLQVSTGRRRPPSESPRMLWYRIRFWVTRWLVGGAPSSGSEAPDAPPADPRRPAGSADGEGEDAGPARRRRKRRAPRRRRNRRGRGQDEPHDVAAAVDARAMLGAVAAVDRWVPAQAAATVVASGVAASSGLRADVCPSAGGGPGGRHLSVATREDPVLGSACSVARHGMPLSLQLHGSPGLRQRSCSVGSSCSVRCPGAACLRGDNVAIEAAEAFLSGQRDAALLGAGSPGTPGRSLLAVGSQPRHGSTQAPAAPAGHVLHATGPATTTTPSAGDRVSGSRTGHASTPHVHATTPSASLPGHAGAEIAPVPLDVGAAAAADDGDDQALSALLRQFRRRLDDPLLPLPDPKVVRRRLFHVAQPSARRSRRLAAKGKGAAVSVVKRAQRLLMEKLGVCQEGEQLSADQLRQYADIFASPLGPEQVAAIAALFGLRCDDAACDVESSLGGGAAEAAAV